MAGRAITSLSDLHGHGRVNEIVAGARTNDADGSTLWLAARSQPRPGSRHGPLRDHGLQTTRAVVDRQGRGRGSRQRRRRFVATVFRATAGRRQLAGL